jgi:hypothetical protein
MIYYVVESADMRPIHDYVDYTKFVNGEFSRAK